MKRVASAAERDMVGWGAVEEVLRFVVEELWAVSGSMGSRRKERMQEKVLARWDPRRDDEDEFLQPPTFHSFHLQLQTTLASCVKVVLIYEPLTPSPISS